MLDAMLDIDRFRDRHPERRRPLFSRSNERVE
jgi:hypothetical protein